MLYKLLNGFRSKKMARVFPFLVWLPELRRWSVLKADLYAGLIVSMLLIPQAMAYALLAGVPVYLGLYAAFIPTIIAALFASSRTLSTGPVPVTSLLTAVALQPMAAIGTEDYITYLILLTLLIGVIQMGLGLIRFGVVVNFVSYPVLVGLLNAVAIIIACLQINNLFGVFAVNKPHFYQTIWQVLKDATHNPHWPTVGIALTAFAIILIGKKLRPHWPNILFAVVVTSLMAWAFGYEKNQIIHVNQMINPPVQKMLRDYQSFPVEMQQQLKIEKKYQEKMETVLKKSGANSEEADEVINQAALAKWELERLITRHNMVMGELSRLVFKKMVTPEGEVAFFVEDQMTPIGQVDSKEWRIDEFPKENYLMMQSGGEVVGNVPKGLPVFHSISFNWQALSDMFIAALVIALVGFTESITIAKRIAAESRQNFDTNQELFSQGIAKFIGGFFQCMPVSGSFTRTALNYQTGAKTPFSSVVAGLIVMIVLLWLTPLFYYLPYATLGVIIMVGVLSLLDIKEMWRIWRINQNEGIVALITFLMALALAPRIAYAVVIGMLMSLGMHLYQSMRPRISELARNQHGKLVELTKTKKYESCYLISLIRLHGTMYFANSDYFENKILNLVQNKQKVRYIILDCFSINRLDSTGVETLKRVSEKLEDAGVEIWFTRVRRSVLNVIVRSGLYDKLGKHHFYKDTEIALSVLGEHLGQKHMKNCPLARHQ